MAARTWLWPTPPSNFAPLDVEYWQAKRRITSVGVSAVHSLDSMNGVVLLKPIAKTGMTMEAPWWHSIAGDSYSQSLAGTLSFSGSLDPVVASLKAIAGELSFSGGVSAAVFFAQDAAGEVDFAGQVLKSTRIYPDGEMGFSGSIVKSTGISKSGELSFSGTSAPAPTFPQAVSGSVGFEGALDARITLPGEGVVSKLKRVLAALIKRMRRRR